MSFPQPSRASESSTSAQAVARPLPRYALRTKDLDFLILAGCSCLLTFLYHPALDQLQGNTSNRLSSKPSPSGTSRSTSTSQGGLSGYSAIVPKRQRFQIEERDT